jgi:acyl carrier protein
MDHLWLLNPREIDIEELSSIESTVRENLDSIEFVELALQLESIAQGRRD